MLAGFCVAAGCGEPAAPTDPGGSPPRAGRFGSLRDFVLIERPSLGEGTPAEVYFIDRFEVTRGDWAEFAATPAGVAADAGSAALSGDPALPVGRVDLTQARAFARWRFARLPRSDEWAFASVGDGRSEFPWGSKVDATRANTGELGIGEPLPVGTFESGRRTDGWPYDLVGNVSEWTESVPWSWFGEGELPAALPPVRGTSFGRQLDVVRATPALAVWQEVGCLLPLFGPVVAGGDGVPREVRGADFASPMTVQVEWTLAGDRRSRTGVRLCTTPTELLRALLVERLEPTALDLRQLQRFVQRGRHRDVLLPAWRGLARGLDPQALQGPVGRALVAELGPPGSG